MTFIYAGREFINVRCGSERPGAIFLAGRPTLSGLMSVLSVPVLTMSLSRLQFLLAIATRLPFWPGPADLRTQRGKHCLGWSRRKTSTFTQTESAGRGSVGGGRGLTSDVIFVGGVDLFYSPVAEGQFPHPVHAAPHARGQAEVGAGGGRVEAVCGKVVRAEAETETETGRAVSEGAEPEGVGRNK